MAYAIDSVVVKGKKVWLRPMRPDEFRLFYRWATRSDATPYWYGEIHADEIPSYIVFRHEWPPYYFDGSRPELGRCFVIMLGEEKIGQINYNQLDLINRSTQLDILIASQKHMDKGYGSDAINTFITYLGKDLHLRSCWVEVVSANPRAVKAFEKVGFHVSRVFLRDGLEWNQLVIDIPQSSFYFSPGKS